MKLIDIYNYCKSGLKDSLEAKILVSYLINIETRDFYFYLNNDYNLNKKNLDKLINRRLNGEPLSKIIGIKNFWDYDFKTTVDVLDPRSDSETMIEYVLGDFNVKDKLKILDLGTGSGCLILTLLKIFKNASGVAVDISEKSLMIAKENAKNLNVNNIEFIKSNWNDDVDGLFDIIISNPPYIKTKDINNLMVEVKKYDPLLALDGGFDGLDCYRYIANNIRKSCKNSAKIYLEIGFEQKDDVVDIFDNFIFCGCKKDLSDNDRVVKFSVK